MTLYTITDFNFIAPFCQRTIFNKINNNNKVTITNGFVAV